jgi:pimeloyl-ACP methyl ester carboxylesterase
LPHLPQGVSEAEPRLDDLLPCPPAGRHQAGQPRGACNQLGRAAITRNGDNRPDPGGRVSRAGIASGAGAFQLVPGALDDLDDNDRGAVSLLPDDPAAAASAFAAGFEPLAELARVSGGFGVVSAFEDLLSARDSELLGDQRFASAFADTMHEALRQGTSGAGWDNVSWIGGWDIDLSAVRCPVLLWYGSDDRFAPPAHGSWLSANLPRARLVLRDGEGHLGIYEHLGEMLDALTEPDTADPTSTVRP